LEKETGGGVAQKGRDQIQGVLGVGTLRERMREVVAEKCL